MTLVTDLTFQRLADELAYRFEPTFTRDEVTEAVERARAELEPTSRHPEFLPVLVERAARAHLTSQARSRGETATHTQEILFVCRHNEGRSQMAAALAQHLSDGHVHVRSAGTAPTGLLNTTVVEALAERGIELDHAYPTPVRHDILALADVVVTMDPSLPEMPGHRQVHWDVEDPHHRSLDDVRAIRDDIESRVVALLDELDALADAPATSGTSTAAPASATPSEDETPERPRGLRRLQFAGFSHA